MPRRDGHRSVDDVRPNLTPQTLHYCISELIAFAGLTIGGSIAYACGAAAAALRHWLKIN
ncbi:hypothetical protein GFM44_37180 [Rhizobium leguminosarum bv. viciae]|nr:hypothetical protein [Rhizobium leguminosarum bv. viciae]